MVRFLLLFSLLALAAPVAALQDPLLWNDARNPARDLPANGHWECWCDCVGTSIDADAQMPGKCEASTEGSACSINGGPRVGTLKYCEDVFVIDS